jgi:hypothetical protein
MSESEAEMEAESAEQQRQRRMVAQHMPYVPDYMHIKEGYYMMNMLYHMGRLDAYVKAMYDADDNGLDEDGEKVEFSDCFDFDNKGYIKIDPETGRITHLSLWSLNHGCFDLPPIIEYFQMLECIELFSDCNLGIELGNLPLLETIEFSCCTHGVFENIPDGLRLPSIKKVTIFESKFDPTNLLSFLKIFPNTLEELQFNLATREQSDEILRILENDDLGFAQSLTTLDMRSCKLTEDDLKRLIFDIRPKYPNLRTIDVSYNSIRSLLGIEGKIMEISSASSSSSQLVLSENNLRKLDLFMNPVRSTNDYKEIAAVKTLLDAFNGISYIGLYACNKCNKYDPDIEYKLRINQAGRSNFMVTDNNPIITMNRALWPLILKRAYKTSAEIYDNENWTREEVEQCQCASGLFHMVRNYAYSQIFVENHTGGATSLSTSAAVDAKTTTTTTTNPADPKNNISDGNRKRKYT